MRRRAIRIGLLVAAWVAAVAVIWRGPENSIIKGPCLQNVQPDQATIVWETRWEEPGTVEFGPTPDLGRTIEDAAPVRIHKVTLTGLAPKTTYHYRVPTGREPAATEAFTTAFVGEGPFSFAVYGDSRSNPEVHGQVVRLIQSWRPDFVLHTGDLTSGWGYSAWGRDFFRPAAPLIATTCLWPAQGNHDLQGNFYFDFFALPKPERWYTFRWGNARFFALDTNALWPYPEEQQGWLDAELARDPATWTIVFLHAPPYSGGTHGGDALIRELLVPIFEKRHVDLVFAGHDHIYERTVPLRAGERDERNGVTYVVTGGGGAPLYRFTPESCTASGASCYHACLVKMNGSDLHFEARDTTGMLLDTFDLRKGTSRDATPE